MSDTPQRVITGNRFSLLLGTLVVLLISTPVVHQLDLQSVKASRVILSMFFVFMLASAIFAVSESRGRSWICAGLLTVAAVLDVLQTLGGGDGLLVFTYAANAVALAALVYEALRHLFRTRIVTFDTIAASLCVYLLLAVMWASIFSLIDVLQPEAFQFNIEYTLDKPRMRFGDSDAVYAIYYSLVTITTLGYGDIVPVTGTARLAAALEAVMGSLYLAVLVARLVALHISGTVHHRP
jgi:hypothetical protein